MCGTVSFKSSENNSFRSEFLAGAMNFKVHILRTNRAMRVQWTDPYHKTGKQKLLYQMKNAEQQTVTVR